MSLTFTRYKDGSCALDDGGELLWSSDSDDDFLEEFDARIDGEEIEDVIEYLTDAGYLEDGDEVDIVDEDEPGTRTVETLTLDDDSDDDDDEEDMDEEGESWQH